MLYNAYLNFDGKAEEATTFYAASLGRGLDQLTRFGDMPMEGVDPTRFRLMESRAFPIGAAMLVYDPAGRPTYGNASFDAPQRARDEPPVAGPEAV